jgi:hypothetical protein
VTSPITRHIDGLGRPTSTTTARAILLGTVATDAVDSLMNQASSFFKAVATKSINMKPEKHSKRLPKAANEFFAKYPPE